MRYPMLVYQPFAGPLIFLVPDTCRRESDILSAYGRPAGVRLDRFTWVYEYLAIEDSSAPPMWKKRRPQRRWDHNRSIGGLWLTTTPNALFRCFNKPQATRQGH